MPSVPDYRAIARADAVKYGVNPDIFERQIQRESGFDPSKHNPSGATGIAQIIPQYHPTVNPSDPIASLDYAARWMGQMLTRDYQGSYPRALAAYNWGPGRVATWDGRPDTLPPETRIYLNDILGTAWPITWDWRSWLPSLPTVPSLPGLPSLPSGNDIGTGIVGAVQAAFGRAKASVIDGGVEKSSPWILGAVGVSCIAWGVLIAAISSPPGQAATQAAGAAVAGGAGKAAATGAGALVGAAL